MMQVIQAVTNLEVLGICFVGLLGLIIGSFLNVVILRLHTGRGSGGRSMCLACTKQLTWIELVPVLSFFALGRRCRGCKSKLSWQYPLVELATAVLFVVVFLQVLPVLYSVGFIAFIVELILLLAVWSIFVVIFVYDLYHKIIPDVLAYTLAIITLVYRGTQVPVDVWLTVGGAIDMLAGLIFFIPFWMLWYVSNGRWIGLGDGKLALSIGWLLGLWVGISAIVISFWIGALVGIALVLISTLNRTRRGITMKAELPFAPFLIAGTLICFIAPIDFLNLSLLFALP